MDFVICDKKNISPILAIELDDSSHLRQNRMERDEFINQVFEDIELPLLRIPVKAAYNVEDLTTKINEAIQRKKHISQLAKPPSA